MREHKQKQYILPSAIVINEAAKRNNILLDDLADSIFKEKANDFLKFIQSPSQNISLNFDYKTLLKIAENLHIPFGYLFLESLPKENQKVAELRRKNPRHQI